MKKSISIICCMLALVLSLTACAQSEPAPTAVVTEATALADGGTILLSVNPEIAVNYDNSGFVTGITAKNDDAFKILASYEGFNGKQAHTVVSELVSAIGEAGYFVEEVEGEARQIILEIEPGSAIPGAHFVDYVVREVQKIIDANSWQTPVNLDGMSDFGSTEYAAGNPNAGVNYSATNYSADKNGVSDFNQPVAGGTDYSNSGYGTTDYAPSDYGTTDFAPSDYGTSDFDTTDYDNNNTDYGNSNYNDPNTDYGNSGYNDPNTDYGNSNYNGNNTDYGNSNYGSSNTDYGNSDYNDGESDYKAPVSSGNVSTGGSSDYDDGDSDYKAPVTNNPPSSSGNSDYGNSDYGDSAYEAPAPAPAPAPNYGGGDSGYSDYSGYGES